jgi:hypothetical protein
LSQETRKEQVYQPAQLNDWAMFYLLMLFGAEQRSPDNVLLQNWYSGRDLLYNKGYYVRTRCKGEDAALTAAASALTQERRALPSQLLATKPQRNAS